MIGLTFSHYRVLSKLGEGGMGTVYLAEDTLLGRRVAIKTLRVASVPSTKNFRTRFLREARSASLLNHPNIATIYDYGETEDGQPYLVMELIEGQNLSDLLRAERLPLDRTLTIVAQVINAIAEAHSRGIVHRDIKPSNVALNLRNEVKVLDFGLAKNIAPDSLTTQRIGEPAASITQTLEGAIIGTPSYLSPEQALGMPVDKRSDLFAIGALLYECLTGRPAFSGSSVGEILTRVIRDDPSPPSQFNPGVPPELDRITLKALHKKTEARYQTAASLLEDLTTVERTLLSGKNTKHRLRSFTRHARSSITRLSARRGARTVAVVVATLVVVALISAVWMSIRRFRPPQPSAEAQRLYDAGVSASRDGSYVTASKLLEQAIQIDPRFPLMHARLAEVWMDLDYEGKATDEMLRVAELAPNLSDLPPLDTLYLQAIAATVRRNHQGAIQNYQELINRLPEGEKVTGYFDLGRAYDRARDVNHAIEAYEEVTRRDPRAAPAYLRLGNLYGRRQDAAKTGESFDKAFALYNEQGNVEGMAEVFFQRGAFLNLGDKLAEAQEQLQQALDLAFTTNNKSQQVKTLLQLGSVCYSQGDTVRAEQYATRAIELARSEQLDNLTTNGLIDIGNALFLRGEYAEAEKHFQQALEIAKVNKGRRGEARALLSLGSLLVQQGNAAEALGYLEPALAFYRQGDYRKEISQALLLLGYANKQRGNNEAALESFNEQLQLSQQVNDQAQVAHTHAAIGLVLLHQERFGEALKHFDESYRLNQSLGLEPKMGYDLVNRGNLLYQMGNYSGARTAFDQAFDVASRPGGIDKQLLAWIHLFKARMDLSELRYAESLVESRKAEALGSAQDKDFSVQLAYTQGLAQLRSGTLRAGLAACQKALDLATSVGDPRLVSNAQVALAEALLASGEAANAATIALQAQETLARLGSRPSEWRAWLLAAQASKRQSDQKKVDEYSAHAAGLLTALERTWGANDFASYISRPDVRRYRKELNELLPGTH